MMSMTTNQKNTRHLDGRDYPVVPDRLTDIDGREYVRCPLHGLIPLDHHCVKTPGDHWCRTAAHPSYDPASGLDGLDDQACTSEDWDRILTAQRGYWYKVAQRAVEALRVADLYLDGFVWLEDPEYSELRAIKRRSKLVQRAAAMPIQGPKKVTERAVPHLYAESGGDEGVSE